MLGLKKFLPFVIPEAWKRYSFRAEPPRIGQYRECPPTSRGVIPLTNALRRTAYKRRVKACLETPFVRLRRNVMRKIAYKYGIHANCATRFVFFNSAEYQDKKECLRDHIAVCLGREYPGHINLVANLLLYQLYHCGNVEYKHNSMYGIVLNSMQCQREAFTGTEICWRYFRERFNANRTDPMLCRLGKYHRSVKTCSKWYLTKTERKIARYVQDRPC